jgi:NAD(P)-dependent dehydrogenase (short-subunit alcohol dehydrogenase family)
VTAARIAVVTGAASGIGRALALDLARQGAALGLSDIDGPGLDAVATACRAHGVSVHAEVVDVADEQAVLTHARSVADHLGVPRLVVANAGIAASGTTLAQSMADVRRVIEVDLFGVIHTCRAFLPALIDGGGRLVTVSSVFGLIGAPKQSAYNAAKFGVRGYTESLRQEASLAGWPVTVSCAHPGGVKTAIARSALIGPAEDAVSTARMFDLVAHTSAPAAARAILRGAAADRPRILIGADARVFAGLARGTGAGYTDLVGRSWWGRRIFGLTGAGA